MVAEKVAGKCGIRITAKGSLIVSLEEPYELVIFRSRWGYPDWRLRGKPPAPFWWRFIAAPREIFFICNKKSLPTLSAKKKRSRIEFQFVCSISRDDIRSMTMEAVRNLFFMLCEACELCRTIDWIPDPQLHFIKFADFAEVGVSWSLRHDYSFVRIVEQGSAGETQRVRNYEWEPGRCVEHV